MFFFVIVVAHWRLDNAKSPVAMLQEKTARKPHTARVADVVRTYIPQVGYLVSSLIPGMLYVCNRMHERENTARHSSTAKTMKMEPKRSERKKSPSPLVYLVTIFCLVGTPYTRSKRRRKKNRT